VQLHSPRQVQYRGRIVHNHYVVRRYCEMLIYKQTICSKDSLFLFLLYELQDVNVRQQLIASSLEPFALFCRSVVWWRNVPVRAEHPKTVSWLAKRETQRGQWEHVELPSTTAPLSWCGNHAGDKHARVICKIRILRGTRHCCLVDGVSVIQET
jgi:hypothetical protein